MREKGKLGKRNMGRKKKKGAEDKELLQITPTIIDLAGRRRRRL